MEVERSVNGGTVREEDFQMLRKAGALTCGRWSWSGGRLDWLKERQYPPTRKEEAAERSLAVRRAAWGSMYASMLSSDRRCCWRRNVMNSNDDQ